MTLLFGEQDLPIQVDPRVSFRHGDRPSRGKGPDGVERSGWPLQDGINVVLFAGMGGACQGLEDAGYPVHLAVNHDEVAIAAHKALNPHTHHLQADIYEVEPLEAIGGWRVRQLWASPDCRDHSVAKGAAPRSPRVRSMPWQVCRWTGRLRKRGLGPDVVYLENVREIRGWGPLIAKRDKTTGRVIKLDGTVAAPGERVPVQEQQLVRDPARAGQTYRAWVRHMQKLGATYEDRDLACADYGVPTTRKRLFGIAHFDGLKPIWPTVTHAHRLSAAARAGSLMRHVPTWTFIDWSLPLPSIFSRKKPLAAATQKRIAVGMKRFVLEAEKPFLIHLTHHGARPANDVEDSAPTFTGAHRGEMALVGPAVIPTTHTSSPDRVHDGQDAVPVLTAGVKGGELAVVGTTVVGAGGWAYDTRDVVCGGVIGAGGRAAQTPPMDLQDSLNTSTTKEDRCVVAAHVTKFNENSIGQDPREPIDTLMAGAPRFGFVGAYLTRYHGERRDGEARGAEMDDPLPVQTTENRFGVVAVHLVQTGYGERPGQQPRAMSVEDGVGTMVAGGEKHAVVGVYLEEHRFGSVGQPAEEALGAQTTRDHHALVGAWMVQHNTGVVGHTPEESLSTMTTLGTQQQVAGAYLIHQRGTGIATSIEESARTLTTGGDRGGDHIGVVAPFLHHQYSNGSRHQDVDASLATQSTRDRTMVTGAAGIEPPLSPEQLARARQVAEFLRSHGVWSGGDLVVFGNWIVVDIGMRMLTPKEAAAAHELRMPDAITVPKRYTGGKRKGLEVRDVQGNVVYVTRPLTKTEAMRLIGNSVPKRMAMLLAILNAPQALNRPRPPRRMAVAA